MIFYRQWMRIYAKTAHCFLFIYLTSRRVTRHSKMWVSGTTPLDLPFDMNAIQRLKATVTWMVEKGIDTTKVPREVAEQRIKICEGCEFFFKTTRQCKTCLCFMDVKTKLVIDPIKSAKAGETIKSDCPKNFWGAYSVTNPQN